MKIEVANKDYPDKRLWLELPITGDPAMVKTISRLATLMEPGQTEVTVIATDVESHVPNLKKHILKDDYNSNIEQMNLLAQKIERMSGVNLGKFAGALEIEPTGSMYDILRIADNLDSYDIYPEPFELEQGMGMGGLSQ